MAESFGSDPERYDRSRPRYPDAMVERIVAASPGPDVLDVGCGTGIAARQFAAAGCRVLGVEPDARMAEWARQGGLAVEVATFEDWDPAGRAFATVTAGQSWHWVEPLAGAAKAAAVLRLAGRLAVFRNDAHSPPELADAFAAASRRVLPDALAVRLEAEPRAEGSSMLSTKAAEGIRQVGAVGDPEEWRFEWERSYSRDEWLDGLPTQGFYTRLSADKLDQLLTGHWRRDRCRGRQLHDALHHDGGHRGKKRRLKRSLVAQSRHARRICGTPPAAVRKQGAAIGLERLAHQGGDHDRLA